MPLLNLEFLLKFCVFKINWSQLLAPGCGAVVGLCSKSFLKTKDHEVIFNEEVYFTQRKVNQTKHCLMKSRTGRKKMKLSEI